VAAAAAVAAVVGASLVVKPMPSLQGELATIGPMREIVTRRGERAVLDLPDGSRVVIAPESRLRIPSTYRLAAGPRDVYLDRGDAVFTVEHDAARPFRVTTAYGVAEDLGTEFLVTADTATPAMQVVVVAGEVGLSRPTVSRGSRRRQPLITLGAGELGRIDATGNATVSVNVQTTSYVAWASGTLVFDRTRLDEAIRTLGRWYDLDIRLADSALASRRVTATIRHQSAPRVLEAMAMSLDLRLTQQGATFILSTGGK
jgi:transmembrane sensor